MDKELLLEISNTLNKILNILEYYNKEYKRDLEIKKFERKVDKELHKNKFI